MSNYLFNMEKIFSVLVFTVFRKQNILLQFLKSKSRKPKPWFTKSDVRNVRYIEKRSLGDDRYLV